MGSFFFNAMLVVVIFGCLLTGLIFLNRRLGAHYEGKPHLNFRRQLIQLGCILIAILTGILLIPIGPELRGQLLSLFGLIVSATIALSSTTLVGNAMAGIMLRTINSCRPGDYITVGGYFGRITEMDLLHVEIQTEQRDLTTLPNMYLVTNPVRVMHTSGTVLSVDVSLSYDVSRHKIEKLLIDAAIETGLESPFVQIRELGDYSVTYSISGLLKKVNQLIDMRRALRAHTMDALHEADIEIVSPTFMNTRAHSPDDTFIPAENIGNAPQESSKSLDAIVFDKAEKAESVSRLREQLDGLQQRYKTLEEIRTGSGKEAEKAAAQTESEQLDKRIERLRAVIDRRDSEISTS